MDGRRLSSSASDICEPNDDALIFHPRPVAVVCVHFCSRVSSAPPQPSLSLSSFPISILCRCRATCQCLFINNYTSFAAMRDAIRSSDGTFSTWTLAVIKRSTDRQRAHLSRFAAASISCMGIARRKTECALSCEMTCLRCSASRH